MFHRRSRLRLGKKQDVARQMLRNLVTSILLYESIRTTRKRAKVVQPMVDHLIADQHVTLPTLGTVLKQLDTLMEQGWGYDDTASLLRVLELPSTDNNLPDK